MTEPPVQLLYDAPTIAHKVAELGQRIEEESGESDPLILSNLGGSVIFLADLVRAIRRPVRFDFIQATYSESELSEDQLDIQFPISVNVVDQSLLVVKDVVATAVVDSYLKSQLLQRGAREVRFVALLDLPEKRRTLFESDYSAFLPKKTGLFVGYGLKHRGRYGNLDHIGLLSEGE